MEGVEQDIGKAVAEAGADPYYFPCRELKRQEDPVQAVWQVVRRADGIVLPGGANEMVPGWFAQAGAPHTGTPEWWEDWWRWHLCQLATLLCIPLLCVDLGADYLNLVLGGTLYQDLRREGAPYKQHIARGALDATSWVWNALEIVEPESRLAQCANGAYSIWGACMHRVAVMELATDLLVTARALDGCVEAFERTDDVFGIGLQGDPQQADLFSTQPYTRNLFTMLADEALLYAASRRGELDGLLAEIGAYLRTAPPPRLTLPPGVRRRLLAVPGAFEASVAQEGASLHRTQETDELRQTPR